MHIVQGIPPYSRKKAKKKKMKKMKRTVAGIRGGNVVAAGLRKRRSTRGAGLAARGLRARGITASGIKKYTRRVPPQAPKQKTRFKSLKDIQPGYGSRGGFRFNRKARPLPSRRKLFLNGAQQQKAGGLRL